MGDHKINVAAQGQEKVKFIQELIKDIECLELMLNEDLIEKEPIRIGAEQEFCIVDEDWTPSSKAMQILDLVNDDHFTTELALYNLEINLDPIVLQKSCFSELMRSQLELLQKGEAACEKVNTRPLLAGILPSISSRHIEKEYMTPSPRYEVLNKMMRELRGSDFSLHIMGADELTMLHDSVLFEACNTSYQMHLQIEPDDFVSSYNWSQLIAGPLLSICTNSPMLLGKELWSETRIALFQQSIDTRSATKSLRQHEPRVTFGNDWVSDSVVDIYKDDISRFPLIISREIKESSLDKLKKGEIPKLEALSLHNGTIYRWNRACYGVGGGKPHLRIENRYVPAGPTVIDEVANMAFWVGLMKGRPKEFDEVQDKIDFKDVKANFIKAARTGKQSYMSWLGKQIPSEKLILETLLPIAREGLKKVNIVKDDIDLFLNIIERRTKSSSGSEWQIKNYRTLNKNLKMDNAVRVLCAEMYKNQQKNIPVSDWQDIDENFKSEANTEAKYIYEIMTTELFTVYDDDPADLVSRMMKWKNIHHVPVENKNSELVGVLTWQIINSHLKNLSENTLMVKDIMVSNVISVEKNDHISNAENLMIRNGIGCLPVVKGKELIGIVTKTDFI